MAEAADRMVGVSIGQLVLTILSIGGLAATIWYTRYQARIAGEANNVAREIGKDQSRAYLVADTSELFIQSPKPTIVVNVFNSGQTPARWYQIESCVYAIEEEVPVVFDTARPMLLHGPFIAIANGQKKICGVNSEAVEKIFKTEGFHKRDIVLQGVITYETMFGEVYKSQFLFYATPSYAIHIKKVDEVMTEIPHRLVSCASDMKAYVLVGKRAGV